MSTFPLLKTGAITQYPATASQEFNTDLVVFLDGTEQRSRKFPTALKRWIIDLTLLDDNEVRMLEAFFIAQAGGFESFSFTDPWTSTVFPNCSFLEDAATMQFEAQDRARMRLTVLENR